MSDTLFDIALFLGFVCVLYILILVAYVVTYVGVDELRERKARRKR